MSIHTHTHTHTHTYAKTKAVSDLCHQRIVEFIDDDKQLFKLIGVAVPSFSLCFYHHKIMVWVLKHFGKEMNNNHWPRTLHITLHSIFSSTVFTVLTCELWSSYVSHGNEDRLQLSPAHNECEDIALLCFAWRCLLVNCLLSINSAGMQ